MTASRSRPVLAAVDASPPSSDAVRWAARKATRRDTTLRLVHAGVFDDTPARDHDELLLEHARPIVVGTRRRGPVAGGVLGSTGNALPAHAPCPVAVAH